MKKNKQLKLSNLLEDFPKKPRKIQASTTDVPVVPANKKNLSPSQLNKFGSADTVHKNLSTPTTSNLTTQPVQEPTTIGSLQKGKKTPKSGSQQGLVKSTVGNYIPVSPEQMNRMRARDERLEKEKDAVRNSGQEVDDLPLSSKDPLLPEEDPYDAGNPFAGYIEDLPDNMSLQDYIELLNSDAKKAKPAPKLDSAFDDFEPTEDEQKELSLFNKKRSYSQK